MTAARKKRGASRARRRPAARPSESQVYDGSRLLGTLVERDHTFTARNAAGRKLAKFATLKEAMAALADAAKPSESPLTPAPARATR
jgi:hypothetical protein